MNRVVYDEHLKAEYIQLFNTCVVASRMEWLADTKVKAIEKNRSRYETVAHIIGCPWFLVGVIHHMECGLRFDRHLHNGDPLSAKTIRVPRGRPLSLGPWTWEESAVDALRLLHLDTWKDWSIAGILWKLENYNGLGYRQYHPTVKTPYLWSFTNQYGRGKYVDDGKWDGNCVSQQLGIACILKRAVELGVWKP